MKKKLVLKNKKRFSLFLVLLVCSISTFIFASFASGNKAPEYKTIIVKSGDTLWDIAQNHSSGAKIRQYIYDIKKLNNLNDSTLFAGTKLKLPVKRG